MTELDAELGPLAVDVIEEFGKPIAINTVPAAGDYDPDTGKPEAAEPPAPKQTKAVVEDYNLQGSGQGFASGLIEVGDKKFTVAARALDATPTSADTITMDGVTFTIVNVKVTYSGELPVLYELQGRR